MNEKEINTIEEYVEILKKYMGKVYINEWGTAMAGPNFPKPVVCFNTGISRDSIKHFVDAIGDLNPLYRDREYAKTTKYGTLVAPPTIFYTIVYGHYPEFALPQFPALYVGDTYEWFNPIAEGDEIDWRTTFPTDIQVKQTKKGGTTAFCYGKHEFVRHAGGVPLGECNFRTVHVKMSEAPYAERNGNASTAVIPEYTEEYIQKVYDAQDREFVWGANPHYWEDVTVGEELASVVRGPFTVSECIAWIKASSEYYFCSDRLHRFIHDHTGWGIWHPKLKVYLNFHENLFDSWGALAAQTGGSYTPGGLGSQRSSWVSMMLTNWMGDEGFLWKLDTNHIRKGGYGNVFWCKGKVTAKHHEHDRYWVDVDCHIEDQTGGMVLKGSASVLLPSREGGGVIYPCPQKAFGSFVK